MLAARATYEVLYNGRNITGRIQRHLKGFTYTDKSQGEADELEIVLEDSEHLWKFEWYPTKGDKISAKIYDAAGRVLNCGTFTVDEPVLSGDPSSGDLVTIKAIAAGTGQALRSKTSSAHENKTLREVVNTIAAKHGYQVRGEIAPVQLERLTQYRKTDLALLQQLAKEYGYVFSIRDKVLTFTSIYALEGRGHVLTLRRSDITSYSITDKTVGTYKTAEVRYKRPRKKRATRFKTEPYTGPVHDSLDLHGRVENQQQAEHKAKAALHRANSRAQSGSIEMPGNVLAVAGVNLSLEAFGMLSGIYYTESSSHSVDPGGGYTTGCEIKRVGLVDRSKQKP